MTARAVFALEEGPVRKPIRMWDGDVSVLAWETAGAKAPAVHFAHANGFNALTYRTLFDELSIFMRVYASDLRGHGQSTLAANPKGKHGSHSYDLAEYGLSKQGVRERFKLYIESYDIPVKD